MELTASDPPADSGKIDVSGSDFEGLGADLIQYRRKEIGFVFQFFNLLPTLTAAEKVAKGKGRTP